MFVKGSQYRLAHPFRAFGPMGFQFGDQPGLDFPTLLNSSPDWSWVSWNRGLLGNRLRIAAATSWP